MNKLKTWFIVVSIATLLVQLGSKTVVYIEANAKIKSENRCKAIYIEILKESSHRIRAKRLDLIMNKTVADR